MTMNSHINDANPRVLFLEYIHSYSFFSLALSLTLSGWPYRVYLLKYLSCTVSSQTLSAVSGQYCMEGCFMDAIRSKCSIHPVCLHWLPFPPLSHAWLRPAWSIYHKTRTWRGRWWGGGVQAKGNRSHLAFCFSNFQTSLTSLSCQ